jgi:hypothetical protein
MQQPLVALCEVAYADVLMPQCLDTVGVVKSQWGYVDEKVRGLMHEVTALCEHYTTCIPHLKTVVSILFEIYNILRSCHEEQFIYYHMTHPDYTQLVKRLLKRELTDRVVDALWRLSRYAHAHMHMHTCTCNMHMHTCNMHT